MLVIRLQRTGRKGHAMFRVVVQDSRQTPSSGKVVAWLGNYDPHAKSFSVDKEKAKFYLEHGAQPSPRIAALLKADGVKLPEWVTLKAAKEKAVRNPEKRRSTRPDEPEAEKPEPEAPAEPTEAPAEEPEKEAVPEAEVEEATAEEAEPAAETTPEAEEATPAPEEPVEAEAAEPKAEAEAPAAEEPSEPETK